MSRAWMPLYVADYLADTGHLSAAEHGAYLLLIMHYWQNGGLPAEDRKLARICRMGPDEWEGARDTLADFFDDGWSHARIDRELATADQISEKARAKANRRWQKPQKVNGSAEAMPQHSSGSPPAEPAQCQSQSPSPNTSSLRSDVKRALKPTPRSELESVLDDEHADAVLDHRQRMKSPLTARAAKLIAAEFAKCPDPNAAADTMIALGWRGFEAQWLENRKATARGQGPPKRGSAALIEALETGRSQ